MSVNKVDKTTGNTSLLAGSTLWADSPIGSILPYGGASAPSGWFLCQGQAVSRITYSELFAVIGTSFGSGDGSTTFNIPDLRGEFLRGAGTNSHANQGNGGAVGEHQDASEILNYYANNSGGIDFSSGNNYNMKNADATRRPAQSNITLSGTAGTGNVTWNAVRPTNTSVNYIIKAKMIGVPADFLAKVDEAVEESMGHSKVTIPFSSFVNPESHVNSVYSQLVWHKFSNYGVLHFAILVDDGVAVDTRCMITENVKSLLGITNAWGREEVGVGGIINNDNTTLTAEQATVELRTGNDDDLRFRISSSNGGWIRGLLFLSKS